MSEIPIQVKITADTDQAIAGIKKVDSAVDAFSKSSKKAASGSNVLTGSFGKFNASALASNRSRMITQQLSQVAQQSTATGNVMQALAIQAADIGLAFGVAGTIIGAPLALLSRLLSQLLATAQTQVRSSRKPLRVWRTLARHLNSSYSRQSAVWPARSL